MITDRTRQLERVIPLRRVRIGLSMARGRRLRFRVIASDYDRTLAHEGRTEPETLDALRRARASGRKLVLITGRTLADLRTVFSELAVFDLVIAENGAWLFDPDSGHEEPLCAPPSRGFLRELRKRGVPFVAGKRVVATIQPHELVVSQLIKQMNLDLEITLNRESVMVLPGGVNKGSGLAAALARLSMVASEVVGIGDAENDFAFLCLCGFSVAVGNAIDSLKQQVDLVTRAQSGAGAIEVIDRVLAEDALPSRRTAGLQVRSSG